jgi:hypothetical protein
VSGFDSCRSLEPGRKSPKGAWQLQFDRPEGFEEVFEGDDPRVLNVRTVVEEMQESNELRERQEFRRVMSERPQKGSTA